VLKLVLCYHALSERTRALGRYTYFWFKHCFLYSHYKTTKQNNAGLIIWFLKALTSIISPWSLDACMVWARTIGSRCFVQVETLPALLSTVISNWVWFYNQTKINRFTQTPWWQIGMCVRKVPIFK